MQTAEEQCGRGFPKAQKLCGDKAIGQLFESGSSFSKFPFKVVYLLTDERREGEAAVRMLVSVGKKRFKRAVKRNRVKRQAREAWRLSKAALEEAVSRRGPQAGIRVALIFCGNELPETSDVAKAVSRSVEKLATLTQEGRQ